MNKPALTQVLDQTLNLSRQMLDCLGRENNSLVARQYQQLIEVAQLKQHLVEQLDQLDAERQQLAGQAQDFTAWLQQKGDRNMQTLWSAVQGTIRDCAQKNEINGRLLQRQHQMTRETMGILTGRRDNGERIYDAQGKTHGNNSLLPNIEA